MAKKFGFIAFDKTGYAVRAYIAWNSADANRAAAMEMGDTLGKISRMPLGTVKYSPEPLLQPADLTTNYGWGELSVA